MSTKRQPFTPQQSPSQPASEASPTLSEGRRGEDGTMARDRRSVVEAGRETANISALRGWTAHQSHGQATVLFYVPRWTREGDLDVRIGERYVIAGLEGQAPVIKASLAGRVNVRTSAWQLEKRKVDDNHGRRRSRSRRSRTSSSSAEHSSGGSQSSDAGRRNEGSTAQANKRIAEQSTFKRTRHGTQSPSQQSDVSEFDLLARSTDTFGSGPSTRRTQVTDAGELVDYSPAISSPASLSQSMTLSEAGTGEYVPSIDAASRSASSGDVRSVASSSSAPHNRGDAVTEEQQDDEDLIRDAKLVTLHLDKLDGGIWPCIVSGPAPAQHTTEIESTQRKIAKLINTTSRTSLDVAIRDALAQSTHRAGHSRTFSLTTSEEGSEEHHGGLNVNESTVTVDTIGSDDDTTVLGVGSVRQGDEERFNMDPISLTLLGLQHARAGAVGRGTTDGTNVVETVQDQLFGFECLRRAWKEAEIPAAITSLVDDFLPLRASSLHALAPYRQRLTAALGGASALARLYVSYAHIHMAAYDHEKPLLSLPMSGTSNNPFGTSSPRQRNTSPRLGGGGGAPSDLVDDSPTPGPLQFLEEAQRCDPALTIGQRDWLEAKAIEEACPVSESWSRAISVSSEAESGSRVGSEHATDIRRTARRVGNGNKKRRSSKRDKLGGSTSKAADDSLVFLVVSRAALLSVVVAGGVAVAGWWRRAAAAAGGTGA